MGGCFSLQYEHVRQVPAAKGNLIEYPVGNQPQQPGGGAPVAKSLCQSICSLFWKCFFSKWCAGGFDSDSESEEMDYTLISSELPLSVPAGEVEGLIQNHGMIIRSATVAEMVTSLQKNHAFPDFTRENGQGDSASISNAKNEADGNEVAETGADGNEIAGTRTDDRYHSCEKR